MQTSFEIVFPVGAAGNFIKYWIGVGLEFFKQQKPIALKDWVKFYPNAPSDFDKDGKHVCVWCEEINEYCVHDKRLPGRHPSYIMFQDPKHSVPDNFKRILVQCDDVKDYVIKVMRIKKQKSMGEMSPDDIINKDHKVSNAVNKHLMKQNTPSIILDYKKFFIEQNQSHIDEIAKFVGFMSDTTSNNLIKYYTGRNKILYESDRLH
jgi:hypothetical protein